MDEPGMVERLSMAQCWLRKVASLLSAAVGLSTTNSMKYTCTGWKMIESQLQRLEAEAVLA